MTEAETDFNNTLISQIVGKHINIEKEEKLAQLNTDLEDKSKELSAIRAEILARKKHLEEYKSEQKIYTKNERISSLEEELTAKNTLIISLNEKISKFEENKKIEKLTLSANPEPINDSTNKLKKATQAILFKERKFQSILKENRANIDELKNSLEETSKELTKANASIIEFEKLLSLKTEEENNALKEKEQISSEMAIVNNKLK